MRCGALGSPCDAKCGLFRVLGVCTDPLPPSPSLSAETYVLSSWKDLHAIGKELQDVFVFPSRDVEIVVTKSELKF